MKDVISKTKKYPTPFYVFDLGRVEKNYQEIHKSLPGVRIHYAVKANPSLGILERLNTIGSGFEIASVNELDTLISIGVSPSEILYSAPVKPGEYIKKAFDAGVRRFAFDNFSEIDKISQFAPKSEVYLRIAVSDNGSRLPLSSKFGASINDTAELMQYAKKLGLIPWGIAFHVGSQSTNLDVWELAIQSCGFVINELAENNIKIKVLNMGGGIPVRYTEDVPELDEIGLTIKRSIKRYAPYKVDLIIEPGRAMVANAGVLVTSVISRAVRSNRNWLYTDTSAFHGLLETMPCQGAIDYPVDCDPKKSQKAIKYIITGPTCDSFDTYFYKKELPSDLKIGDRLYIQNIGAYSLSFASNYNGFSPPGVLYLDGGKIL